MLITAGRGGTSTFLLILVPITIFVLWYTHPRIQSGIEGIDWQSYTPGKSTKPSFPDSIGPGSPVTPAGANLVPDTAPKSIPESPLAADLSEDEKATKLENAQMGGMAPVSDTKADTKPATPKTPDSKDPFADKVKAMLASNPPVEGLSTLEEQDRKDLENGKPKSLKPAPGYPAPPNAPPAEGETDLSNWHIVKALTTRNGSWFHVDFLHLPGINPNIIPHPDALKPDTWVAVAQQHKRKGDNPYYTAQLVCEASFKNQELICNEPPLNLPIAATAGGMCGKELSFLDIWNIGPHDARVLYGPHSPYIIFGSNSQRNCFGMFFQDFRMLLQWPEVPQQKVPFRHVVELQRPPPLGHMEKNWFPFWDENDVMYFHHDTYPFRVFAKQNPDGSVGPDLAPAAKEHDEICMGSLMPAVHIFDNVWRKQSIHQATNSLKVTMCNRADSTCHNSTDNTYIMHIFNHKSYVFMHGIYEPYVMLFRETAPFEVHAISKKPIWLSGRKLANEDPKIAANQTDMCYPTSINWKAVGRNYHGYLDDEIILGFGIEDSNTAALDMTAKDLLGELNYCSDLGLDVGTGKKPKGGYKQKPGTGSWFYNGKDMSSALAGQAADHAALGETATLGAGAASLGSVKVPSPLEAQALPKVP